MTLAARYTELSRLSDLNAGIESVWTSISDHEGSYRVLPDGRCDIILQFKPEKASALAPTAAITGPTTFFYDVPLEPGTGFVGIRLRPGHIQRILGLEPVTLKDRNLVGVAALQACPELAALCRPVKETNELLGRLINFVHNRSEVSDFRPSRLVSEVLSTFHASSGRLPVGDVAQMHGIGVRTIRRMLIGATGLSPKAFAGILRFHRALRLLRDHHLTPAEAALEAGFADQPHMNRVFRRMGGISPARLPAITLVTIRA